MNYIIKYRPVEDSVVFAFEDKGEEPRKFFLKGKEEENEDQKFMAKPRKKKVLGEMVARKDFLQNLNSEDILWLELGGGADKFCLAAARRGVPIFRLPTYWAKETLGFQKKEKEAGKRNGVQGPEEILLDFAKQKPEKFYPWREIDQRIARIRLLDQCYLMVQKKMRQAMENRFRALNQDLEFLTEGEDHSLVKEIGELYLQAVHPEYLERIEARIRSRIKKALEGFVLYEALGLDNIKGCAELISARIIGRTEDIRRFKTEQAYRAFAGWHLVKDKEGHWKLARRQKGQKSNWDRELRTTFYTFAEEMERQSPDHPWKLVLDQRKAFERERHPELKPFQIRRRALRWIIWRFIHQIWSRWREFEGLTGEVKVE